MKAVNRKHKAKLTVLMFNMVFLLIASIVSIYAWFELRNAYQTRIETGKMDAEVIVMFDQINGIQFYDQNKNAFLVNAFDQNADNYIGKIKVMVNITSNTPARVRIKFQDEWQIVRTLNDETIEDRVTTRIMYHEEMGPAYLPFSPFKWGSSFNPLFDNQGYIYYPGIVKNNQTTPLVINLVNGGDPYPKRVTQVFTEECYVYVNVRVEIVQANRVEQIWNISPSFFDEEGGQS